MLLALLFSVVAAAAKPIQVTHPASQVEFLAIGRPSALKIRGKVVETEKEKKPLEGALNVAGEQVTGKVSLKLDSLDTGIALRDQHMKEKYLETAKYPKAELTVTKLSLPKGFPTTIDEAKDLPFEGTLQLHGVTKPVKGVAEAKQSKDITNIGLEFTIKVSDFGITIPSYLGVTVADDVAIVAKASGTSAE